MITPLLVTWPLRDFCVFFRPAGSQPYNQGAVNLSGPQPGYPQHYGAQPTMQQVTNQMTGMQITSGPPTPAGPGYGNYAWICTQNVSVYCPIL